VRFKRILVDDVKVGGGGGGLSTSGGDAIDGIPGLGGSNVYTPETIFTESSIIIPNINNTISNNYCIGGGGASYNVSGISAQNDINIVSSNATQIGSGGGGGKAYEIGGTGGGGVSFADA